MMMMMMMMMIIMMMILVRLNPTGYFEYEEMYNK